MAAAERAIVRHRLAWSRKAGVRRVYADYHRRILEACKPGVTVEIGCGSGHLGGSAAGIIAMDIEPGPGVAVVADAHQLPLADKSVDNLVMLDVLHHLAHPRRFLTEAVRVLKPGGRLVLIEPAMTPGARLMYGLFHHEPFDLAVDALGEEPVCGADSEDANMAVPHLLFKAQPARLGPAIPGLRLLTARYLSLWAYPLSGGFQEWSLLPGWLAGALLRLEDLFLPLLGPLAAFRLFIVCERT